MRHSLDTDTKADTKAVNSSVQKAYLHVLASGSYTSIVLRYVVPSNPPTAINCPFTTASPTCEKQTEISYTLSSE